MKFHNQALSLLVIGATLGLPAFAAGDSKATAPETSQFVASVPNSACAKSGACMKGSHGRHHGPRISFSDDQLEKFSSIKNQYLAETAPIKTELMSARRQQKDLITKPDSDRSQIIALQDKINGLKSKLSSSSLKYRLDRFAILTPDQQKTIRHKMLVSQAFGGFRHRG